MNCTRTPYRITNIFRVCQENRLEIVRGGVFANPTLQVSIYKYWVQEQRTRRSQMYTQLWRFIFHKNSHIFSSAYEYGWQNSQLNLQWKLLIRKILECVLPWRHFSVSIQPHSNKPMNWCTVQYIWNIYSPFS